MIGGVLSSEDIRHVKIENSVTVPHSSSTQSFTTALYSSKYCYIYLLNTASPAVSLDDAVENELLEI